MQKESEPTLDRFGVGVHGKSCWLIACNNSGKYCNNFLEI